MAILVEFDSERLEAYEARALMAFLLVLHPEEPEEPKREAAASGGRSDGGFLVLKTEEPKRAAVQDPPLPTAVVAQDPPLPAGVVKPGIVAPVAGFAPNTLADQLIAAEAARVAAGGQPAPADVVGDEWPRTNEFGVLVDREGLPWDIRIHAASKTLVKKTDTWKLLREIDPALVAKVKAELLTAMSAPAVAPQAVASPMVPVGAGPVAAAPAATAQAYAAATFMDVMSRVVDLNQAGVDGATVNQALSPLGIGQPRDLSVRPDLVPHAMAALAALG